jgi:LPS-assembly protein
VIPVRALLVLLIVVAGAGTAPAQPRSVTVTQDGEEVSIVANRLQRLGGDSRVIIAEGEVELTRGTSRLLADRIEFNQDTGEAVAQGRVIFYDGEERLSGERIDYNVRSGTGVVHEGSAFSAPYYRIGGERMERLGEGVYRVRRGVFTTCEDDDPAWSIRLGDATADVNDLVTGRDASFWVRNIPLIPWFPYFAAAIRRERETGFLFPDIGFSSARGFIMSLPFFWAIDDSQDLTVAPQIYTERGMGGEVIYRYVLSENARGTVRGFYLNEFLRPDDLAVNAPVPVPESRWWVFQRHEWAINPRFSFKTDIQVTSDDQVYRDYGGTLVDRARQFAPSFVSLSRRWDAWNVVGFGYYYQDLVTEAPIELQRLPQISLRGILQPVAGLPRLLYEVDTSVVNFVRIAGSSGVRFDVHPVVRLPIPIVGSFTVTPYLGGRLTYYDTQVVGFGTRDGILIEQTVDAGVVRRLFETGIEATARASRVFQTGGWGGIAALQHVIEPRLGFALVRGSNIDQLPQWDPVIDRIGVTNGLTYSITNRINAKTVAGPGLEAVRWELLRFVVSQTVSFGPGFLVAGASPGQEQRFQELITDLLVQPNLNLAFRATAAWDVYRGGLTAINTDLGFGWRGIVVGIGNRYNDIPSTRPLAPELVPGLTPTLNGGLSPILVPAPPTGPTNYFTGALAARILPNLGVRASTAFDIRAGQPVEVRLGMDLIYQCWAILLEYVHRPQTDDNEIRATVNLLGLGQFGTGFGLGTLGGGLSGASP